MKAIRVEKNGGPEVLQLKELPDPQPGEGQVLIKIKAAGVNPIDLYIREGSHGYSRPLPYTPGNDASGEIIGWGPDIHQFTNGQKVYLTGNITGAYAEKTLCSIKQIQPLPQEINFSQGAALGIPYASAFRAIFQRGNAKSGETILIHGASGGVGTAAVQWAKLHKLKIIATARSGRSMQAVQFQGVHEVLDHHQSDHYEKIMKITKQKGVDLILETLANVNLNQDLTILAPGGRVIVVGSRGDAKINPRDLMIREAEVRGMMLFNATVDEQAQIQAAIQEGLKSKALQPLVSLELPLAEADKAHQLLMKGEVYGKVVLIP